MGKRGKRNHFKGGNKRSKTEKTREDAYKGHIYTNEKFITYYQAQEIVSNENEWDSFMSTLGSHLPITFRINTACKFASDIRSKIESDFQFSGQGKVIEISADAASNTSTKVESISQMKWYPSENGYYWNVNRFSLKKTKEATLKAVHRYIVDLSESGNITRQEMVSMVPPLILDVKPHHKVLDMCAAPGSKTSQLVEMLHADEAATGKLPTGYVVANDLDIKRANMLIHQLKRTESPSLIVTCIPAQEFPTFDLFDRVLCDVPCSGDGTMRKSPDIWRSWTPKIGLSLHRIQLQIATRGAALLKEGGLMVYSTCSFNPIENEAVVAELLRQSSGTLELMDCSSLLPGFKRRSGKTTWKVMNANMEVKESFNASDDDGVRASMFPPKDNNDLKLERCMRCVPMDEDTGGFFICLIKKVKASTSSTSTSSKTTSTLYEPFMKVDTTPLMQAKEFYGISNDFNWNSLLTKSATSKILHCTPAASYVHSLQDKGGVKVIHAGVRLFERNDTAGAECPYRLTQVGLRVLRNQMSSRVISVNATEFQLLLDRRGDLIRLDSFSESVKEVLEKTSVGTIVCELQRGMHVAVWRGRNTVNSMLTKADALTLVASMKCLGLYK